MGQHYDRIKEEIGLKEALENSDEDEEATEAIFRKLRPQSKYRFSEVIKQPDSKKVNKMLGPMGVVLKDQQIQQYNQENYQSGTMIRLGTATARKKKLERHRFINQPEQPRALHNQMMKSKEEFQQVVTTVGNPQYFPRGEGFSMSVVDKPAREITGQKMRPTTAKPMHKMYEPPIPKHLIPTNNPFYNKQIFSPSHASESIGENYQQDVGYQKQSSPRSLLNWINASNTKKVQQRMTNRI